jgi:NAD-dependent dihydropyrimidine dehydrogenase PreA subunit
MEALRLEDYPEAKGRITLVATDNKELKNKSGKVSAVNPDFCIGCGVCAYKCPSNSLVLERKEVIEHPPKDIREHMTLVMADLAAARAQQGQEKGK